MILKKEIKIPIYNQTVWLILGDANEVQSYLCDVYSGDFSFDEDTTNGICLNRGGTSWIWLDIDGLDIGLLGHELLHSVLDLAEYIGIDLKDQEALCYLLEFLLNECKSIFAIQMDLSKVRSTLEDEVQSS